MTQTTEPEAWSADPHHEPDLARFDGTVVQLVAGQAHERNAVVADIHPAVVRITPTRVIAVDGGVEWPWPIDELESVVHASDGHWTILAVPGFRDFGVAVPPEHVAEFRRVLGRVRGEEPESESESEATAAPEPGEGSASLRIEPMDARSVALAPIDLSTTELPVRALEPSDAAEPAEAVTRNGRSGHRRRSGEQPEFMRARPLAGIEGRNVSAWFGSRLVLDRVSLDMQSGQVTALIGPSGCGKSTFLRILNRMHEMIPSAAMAGEVLLDGQDIYDPARKLTDARREIGMVFQKPNPFPAMSIYDNVVASLRLTGTKASGDLKDEIVETCLGKAGLWKEVKDRLRQPGGGLSGGQQQRLCIARALAIKPRVLLMDEPCSALDPTSTRRIEETILELKSEVTIVIVTHNMQQAARVSDVCAFFLAEDGAPGHIVEYGATNAMFGSPQDERTEAYVTGRFG